MYEQSYTFVHNERVGLGKFKFVAAIWIALAHSLKIHCCCGFCCSFAVVVATTALKNKTKQDRLKKATILFLLVKHMMNVHSLASPTFYLFTTLGMGKGLRWMVAEVY